MKTFYFLHHLSLINLYLLGHKSTFSSQYAKSHVKKKTLCSQRGEKYPTCNKKEES